MADNRLIQQAGLEMVAIVMSVLLALFLNNWWQDRQTETNHAKTLVLITGELSENRTDLVEAIDYYKSISPKVAAIMPDGVTQEEANEMMKECCELMSSGTGRTSHEMAIITGLYSALDPNISARIITAFVGQEDLKSITDTMTQGMMAAVDVNDPGDFFGRYYVFTMSITPSLEELLGITDEAIAAIEDLN